ncbi:Ig-like domain-containing protein [Weissella koreensis]|uniref:Ig-like domain-containing protein n=1 Tax=Weissella koreensis TaxID=165096 RepID=UPI002FCF1025
MNPKSVTGVKLNKNTLSLKIGASETLIASVTPEDADNKAGKWASDKTSIATVDKNGKVTAVVAGTAKITFTTDDGSIIATCTVTITTE